MQRIVFGLKDVYNAQCANAGIGLTSSALELNIPGLGYGYLVAGEFPVITTVDRYDLATETMSQPGTNSPVGRAQHQSFADSNYGYYGGGYNGPPATFHSNTYRYDFSNETITDISQNAPEGNRNRRARLYNPSYGYFVGGSPTSKIDRLDFSTQTYTSPGNLPSVNSWAGTVSSASYGYIGGGETPSLTCTIQRMDFSVETISSPGGLPTSVGQICQTTQSDTTGYWGGGYIPGGAVTTCHIERLDFSTEVASKNPGYMSVKRSRGSAIKSPGFGYFCNGSTPPYMSAISRLDFSTDTVSDNPPVGRNAAARASFEINRPQVFKYVPGNNVWKENSDYGYTAGGEDQPTPGPNSSYLRLDFASETTSTPGSKQLSQTDFAHFTSNSNYAYQGAGYNSSNSNQSNIERLDYSNETVVRSPSNFSRAVRAAAGFSSLNYGYWHGGYDSSDKSCVLERLDFSTEVRTNSTVAGRARQNAGSMFTNGYGYMAGGATTPSALADIIKIDVSTETGQTLTSFLTEGTAPGTRNTCRGVSGASYGYIAGGQPGDSIVDRLDFATESTTRIGNLPVSVSQSATMGSSGFGYVTGGSTPTNYYSVVQRIDYSTDSISNPGTPMPRVTSNGGGDASGPGGIATRRVGKATYGYFAGGATPPFSSTIDRLEFSTETIRAPGSYQLTQARRYLATVKSNSYGYFGGGNNPNFCTIDRLDFSNETVAAPGTYQLTQARFGVTATSSSFYGYFGGGFESPAVCTIDRLDFSNETVSNPPASLTQPRYNLAAVSSSSYGYYGGGAAPGNVCTIDRLDFSTETVTAPGTYQLTQSKYELAATSSSFYGYFGGGATPPAVCTIDRLDFSNETVSTNPGQLTQARRLLTATSSSSYGYFGGGYTGSNVSTIDRLDFASDTVSLPSQSLTQARLGLAAVSNG